jgi:hypothetical protein
VVRSAVALAAWLGLALAARSVRMALAARATCLRRLAQAPAVMGAATLPRRAHPPPARLAQRMALPALALAVMAGGPVVSVVVDRIGAGTRTARATASGSVPVAGVLTMEQRRRMTGRSGLTSKPAIRRPTAVSARAVGGRVDRAAAASGPVASRLAASRRA